MEFDLKNVLRNKRLPTTSKIIDYLLGLSMCMVVFGLGLAMGWIVGVIDMLILFYQAYVNGASLDAAFQDVVIPPGDIEMMARVTDCMGKFFEFGVIFFMLMVLVYILKVEYYERPFRKFYVRIRGYLWGSRLWRSIE